MPNIDYFSYYFLCNFLKLYYLFLFGFLIYIFSGLVILFYVVKDLNLYELKATGVNLIESSIISFCIIVYIFNGFSFCLSFVVFFINS